MSFFKYFLSVFALMVLFCGFRRLDTDNKDYQYVEPCMNGCFLVMRDSHYGIVSSDGKEIIPSKYEHIYFLTEDIVATYLKNCWYFYEISGKLIGQESGPSDKNADGLLSDVYAIRMENMQVWEEIVVGFERFCEKCSLDDASFSTMAKTCDSLRSVISQAEGRMSEVQHRRIKQSYNAYLERRRDL